MADALIGYGIGLSGTPKDYTSVVAARQRQQDLEGAKAAQKQDKLFEPIYKSLVVNDKMYMPYRTEEVARELAQTVSDLRAAQESGDLRKAFEVQQRISQKLLQYNQERVSMDKTLSEYNKGNFLLSENPASFYSLKNSEEAKALAAKSDGEYFVDPTLGVIGSSPVKKTDIAALYSRLSSSLKGTPTGETETIYVPDGKGGSVPVSREKVMYRPEDLRARLESSFESDEIYRKNAIFNYKQKFSTEGMDANTIRKNAKDYWIANGMEFLNPPTSKPLAGGKGGINISIDNGGAEDNIDNPFGGEVAINMRFPTGVSEYPLSHATQMGDIVATIPTQSTAFTMGGNKKISRAGVSQSTANMQGVTRVMSQDYTIPFAYSTNNLLPEGVRMYAGTTVSKGQIVHPDLQHWLLTRGERNGKPLLEAAVVTFRKDKQSGTEFYESAGLMNQDRWFSENKQNKPEVKRLHEQLLAEEKKIMSEVTRVNDNFKATVRSLNASPAQPKPQQTTPAKKPKLTKQEAESFFR